jgi:hypothetical protein
MSLPTTETPLGMALKINPSFCTIIFEATNSREVKPIYYGAVTLDRRIGQAWRSDVKIGFIEFKLRRVREHEILYVYPLPK